MNHKLLAKFPRRGQVESFAQHVAEPLTTQSMMNCVAFDPLGRARGAQRPGSILAWAVSGGGTTSILPSGGTTVTSVLSTVIESSSIGTTSIIDSNPSSLGSTGVSSTGGVSSLGSSIETGSDISSEGSIGSVVSASTVTTASSSVPPSSSGGGESTTQQSIPPCDEESILCHCCKATFCDFHSGSCSATIGNAFECEMQPGGGHWCIVCVDMIEDCPGAI
jgi:hypothetical protein